MYNSSTSFGTSLDMVSHSSILLHWTKHIETCKFKSAIANNKIRNSDYVLALAPTGQD